MFQPVLEGWTLISTGKGVARVKSRLVKAHSTFQDCGLSRKLLGGDWGEDKAQGARGAQKGHSKTQPMTP